MSRRLAYGYERTDMYHRLFLDVPVTIHDRLKSKNPTIIEKIESLTPKKVRVLDIADKPMASRLYINANRIAKLASSEERTASLKNLIDVIRGIQAQADPHQRDRFMHPRLAGRPYLNTEEFMPFISVTWPKIAGNKFIAEFATERMQDIAEGLQYISPGTSKNIVNAQVSSHDGVHLSINNLGSGMRTNEEYESESPVFELHAANITFYAQQLICLAGAVAIARADEFLPQSS